MTTFLSSLLLNCLARTLYTLCAQSYFLKAWQLCLSLGTRNFLGFQWAWFNKGGSGNGGMDGLAHFSRTCHIAHFFVFSKCKQAAILCSYYYGINYCSNRNYGTLQKTKKNYWRWIDQSKQRICYKPRKQKIDFSGGRQNSFTYENLIQSEKEKRHCINNARKNEKYIFKHILKMASNICKCAVQSSRDPGAIGRKQIPSAVECCKTILGGISVKLPWPSINSPQVLASSHCHKQGTQLNIYPEFAPQKNTWKYHTNKTNCLWEKIGLHPFLPWWWRLSNSDQRQRTVKNEMKHRRPSAQQSLTSASTYWKLGLCLTPELLPGDSWADQTGEKKKNY